MLLVSAPVRPTVSKLSACSGLALATILAACSAGGDAADADGGGPTTIGGEETGLTLEIPDEWVELPMDADTVSEALGNLDLTDDQAAFVESWIGALPNPDGAVLAIDLSTMTASVASNVNAHCRPNDGSIGRQPGVEASPLQESDLEAMIALAIPDRFGHQAEDIEVESATVDGYPAARATYTFDMAGAAGVGVMYMLLGDDDVCWVTFTGADESSFGLFDEMAATIDVL